MIATCCTYSLLPTSNFYIDTPTLHVLGPIEKRVLTVYICCDWYVLAAFLITGLIMCT